MKVTAYSPYFGIEPKHLNDDDFNTLISYFELLDAVKNPTVSLVVPVYSAKETLVAHILSLANLKTIIPYEVIFVENNADKETLSILEQLGAKVVSQKQQGITFARQKGLEEAKGEIICSMDPDSIYDPYYIDKMALPFFENKDLVLCYSVSKSYEDNFQLSLRMKLRNSLKNLYFRWKLSRGFVLKIKHIRAVCMAMRRDAVLPIGYETDLRAVSGCDDGMLAIKLYQSGQFQFIPVDVYTALPPKRKPAKPFPFCNLKYMPSKKAIQKTYEELQVEGVSE